MIFNNKRGTNLADLDGKLVQTSGVDKQTMTSFFCLAAHYDISLLLTYPDLWKILPSFCNRTMKMKQRMAHQGCYLLLARRSTEYVNVLMHACLYIFFQISATQLDPGLTAQLLLLADSENEKNKWVNALTELQKILRHNLLPDKAVIRAKELFDAAMPLVKISHCAAVLGKPVFWYLIPKFVTHENFLSCKTPAKLHVYNMMSPKTRSKYTKLFLRAHIYF